MLEDEEDDKSDVQTLVVGWDYYAILVPAILMLLLLHLRSTFRSKPRFRSSLSLLFFTCFLDFSAKTRAPSPNWYRWVGLGLT